ncbi:MAG TPA: DHH family phosphoesterase [Candidatus Bathyarchaeia archaeon]|nr:DHH family phosphoesterase [Candidatus Bathyarchaeia archaeon]
MVKFKVVSISHSIDPDGIGSQAIIFRYFRELGIEPVGFLADYNNFADVLEDAIKENPTVLIVSDLGLNSKVIQAIIEPMKNLQARKIWIDHHNAPTELKELIIEMTDEFIHDTTICAAELTQKRFMPEDNISKKIAQIGHNGDFDIKDRLTTIFYTLIDYYRFSTKDLIRIREMLVKGDFDNKEIFEEYLAAYKVFEAERDRIRKELKSIIIDNKTIAIAYSSLLPRGKITKFLSEISEDDILLAIDTTNFRIGLRSEKYDVAAVAAKFGGGGHKHRSGFTFKDALTTDNELSDDFVELLKEALTETDSL